MGILDLFRRAPEPQAASPPTIYAEGGGFYSLDDPSLAEFLRTGSASSAGITVSVDAAMRNTAVFRSTSLLSQSVGMLPLHLVNKVTKEKARDHSLFKVLHRKPNAWQSAYDFRTLMQMRALVKGNGYARIIRSRNFTTRRDTVIGLIPLDPDRVTPIQNSDFSVSYRYQPASGSSTTFDPADIFHLRSMSMDGIRGMSLVRQAADAIGLAIAADLALARLYQNGSFVDGVLATPGKLSATSFDRLRDSWDRRYSGAGNAGRTPILEEGLDYKTVGPSAKDAQSHETRGRQIEEIARIFGVPRPLLMMDETSWGSGIEALGQFFVTFGLNPWFEAWQQAAERSLLSDEEAETLELKFNAGALLRGSLQAQADYFAKALGSGGHQPWMHVDEVRESLDLPEREIPQAAMLGHNGGPPLQEGTANG